MTCSRRPFHLLPTVVLLLLLVTSWVRAAEDKSGDAAREYNKQATAAFKSGDLDTALRNFELAYQLLPDPRVRLNLGLTNEALRRLDEAKMHYEAYLRDNPRSEKSASVRDLLNGLQERMKTWGKVVVVVDPADATVTLAGRPLKDVPASCWLEPGNHPLTVRKDGFTPHEATVQVTAATRQEVRVQLVPTKDVTTSANTGTTATRTTATTNNTASKGPAGSTDKQPATKKNSTTATEKTNQSTAKSSSGFSPVRLALRGVGGVSLAAGALSFLVAALGGATMGGVLGMVMAVPGTDSYRTPLTVLLWVGGIGLGTGIATALLTGGMGLILLVASLVVP